MKKIYSIVLMATALLIGANAWGQSKVTLVNHTHSEKSDGFDDLQSAIDAILPGDTGTITLNADLTLTHGILIPHLTDADFTAGTRIATMERQRICINLAGHNIKTAVVNYPSDNPTKQKSDACFGLIKGVLHLTNSEAREATIERAEYPYTSNWDRGTILVSGTDAKRDGYTGTWPAYNNSTDNEIVNADRSKQEWSTLYIDKNVKINSEQAGTYGIGVQEIGSSYPEYGGFKKKYLGYSCVYGGVANNTDGKMPMWNSPAGYQWSCFGVKVIIAGEVYGERRGVNVLGSINQTPGQVEGVTSRKTDVYPFYDHYFPYVKVCAGADVQCKESGITDDGNGGIYLGGWAVIDIEGDVHGQTGVMVKAGDVAVSGDGKVYSDDQTGTASNIGDYHGTVNGSGIFITSSSSYAGESNVSISGNAKVEGTCGSGIIDVLGDNAEGTKVSHIEITGGEIVGGDQGAITIRQDTKDGDKVAVTGGLYTGEVSVGGNTVNVSTLVPGDSYHETTIYVDPVTQKETILVSTGSGPAESNSVVGATASTSIKWVNTGVTEETLTEDKTLLDLEISETYPQTLNVGDDTHDVTLTARQVVLGAYAKIVVYPGSKLVVTGAQGITSTEVENIVLKTSETKQAVLLFNPAVTNNSHPSATVELISKSFRDGSKWVYQRFGMPTYDGNVTMTPVNPGTINSYVKTWDYVADDWSAWTNLGASYSFTDASPFDGFMLGSTNAKTAPMTYKFTGRLMGNGNADILYHYGWNNLANSYTAPIDINDFVTKVAASGNDILATIYIYKDLGNDTYTWTPVNLGTAGKNLPVGYDNVNNVPIYESYPSSINPMQAFLMQLRTEGTANQAINYKTSVYDPALGNANHAPARFAQVNNEMQVSVFNADGFDNVSFIENDQFSNDLDNGYDAVKYNNAQNIKLYAMNNEERMAILATDNVEGTFLGIEAAKAGNYTMYISGVQGMEYAIVDMQNGAVTNVAEGATYNFYAEAGKNDNRFQIIGIRKITTDIENAEVKANVKGVYTLTGQFLGNDIEALPAGVYIVNGTKVVK